MVTLKDKFWSKVNKHGPYPHKKACKVHPEIEGTRCWEWTGSLSHGYGVFYFGRKSLGNIASHRFAYLLRHGKGSLDNKSWQVLHKCDNPSCVRPSHLFKGTARNNSDDKVVKGRQSFLGAGINVAKGELSGKAKLIRQDVKTIRSLYKTGKHSLRSLGRMFNVHSSSIFLIVHKKNWKHIS